MSKTTVIVGWVIEGRFLRIGDMVIECTGLYLVFNDYIQNPEDPAKELRGVVLSLPMRGLIFESIDDCIDVFGSEANEQRAEYFFVGETCRQLEVLFGIEPQSTSSKE